MLDSMETSTTSVGLETLLLNLPSTEISLETLKRARVGLVAHDASRTIEGTHILEVLQQAGVNIRRLFAPEHGLNSQAAAGELIADDECEGMAIISLYGHRKSPDVSHLEDLDILIFDLQDVGVRAYTYLSTLYECLKMCTRANTILMVLDRPNPLGAHVAGSGMDSEYISFVGCYNVPFVHGLTLGELACTMALELKCSDMVKVQRMRHYQGQPWLQTGRPWHPPSPNLHRLEAVSFYPITVFLEGTTVSEGRGTAYPFEQLGAPWFDATKLAQALNERLPQWSAQPTHFVPKHGKHAGDNAAGVRLYRQPSAAFTPTNPLESAKTLLTILYEQSLSHPHAFRWLGKSRPFIDQLAGAAVLREAVIGEVSEKTFATWCNAGKMLPRVSLY